MLDIRALDKDSNRNAISSDSYRVYNRVFLYNRVQFDRRDPSNNGDNLNGQRKVDSYFTETDRIRSVSFSFRSTIVDVTPEFCFNLF